MITKTKLFVAFLLITLIVGCSSVKVNHDYNNSFNFTSLSTYKIAKETPIRPDGVQVQSYTFSRIKNAINAAMALKGYGKNDKYPDFLITWHTAVDGKLALETGEAEKWNGYWQKEFDPSKEITGVILIDMLNPETGKTIWRGWAKDVLTSTQNVDEKIETAVDKILQSFPPKSEGAFK